MKLKLAIVVMLTALFLANGTAVAGASGGRPTCISGSYLVLAPNHGLAGTAVNATGYNLQASIETKFFWDQFDGKFLGEVINAPDNTASFDFTVPVDAPVGSHKVIMIGFASSDEENIACAAVFEVKSAVAEQAYAQAPLAALPSTGFMLLIPSAGLGLGGLGLSLRRRARS